MFLCFDYNIVLYHNKGSDVVMTKWNDLEQKALKIIAGEGEEGVLQSKLWSKMGASSREGSRISIKLEKKGLIHRTRELSNGRWTYRLYSSRKPLSMDSIVGCPCLTCEESILCESEGSVSPNTCEKITEWIHSLLQDADKYSSL